MTQIPDSELDRIKAYCDAATKGPLSIDDDGYDLFIFEDPEGDEYAGRKRPVAIQDQSRLNYRLYASARTDLPRLVAAYRELRELAMKVVEFPGIDERKALAAYLKGDARRNRAAESERASDGSRLRRTGRSHPAAEGGAEVGTRGT